MLTTRTAVRAGLFAAAVTATVLAAPVAFAADTVVCANPDNLRSCKIVVDAPALVGGRNGGGAGAGSGGGAASPPAAGSGSSGGSGGGGAGAPLGECSWRVLSPDPPASDSRWGGADPATNSLIMNPCNGPGQFAVVPSGDAPGAAPAPAPLPPPDPKVLAAQAIGQLSAPQPRATVAPSPDRLAVNLWSWLAVDDPGPVSTTVDLRGVSVTATAELSTVTWVVGEPTSIERGGAPIAQVTCDGPGVLPPANVRFDQEPRASGACGYLYRFMSTGARTGGVGRWPLTATATWAVTWTSNTGASGTAEIQSPSATTLVRVGEYRTLGGYGSGR